MWRRAGIAAVALSVVTAACDSWSSPTGAPASRVSVASAGCDQMPCVGRFAYTGEYDGYNIHYVDARGVDHTLVSGFGYMAHVTWSPDGSMLAFAAGPGWPAPTHIYVVRVDGTGLAQLTEGAGEMYPKWSPDGTRIAFETPPYWESPPKLSVVTVAGSEVRDLVTSWIAQPNGWTGDGRIVATLAAPSGWGLYYVDATSGAQQAVPLAEGGQNAVVAPDGQTLAFEKYIEGNQAMVTLRPGATAVTRVSAGVEPAIGAVWSPNGKYLLFGPGPDYPNQDIYIAPADGSEPAQNLTPDGTGLDGATSFSPDGKRILFYTDRGGWYRAWVMNADGSDARPATMNTSYLPVWRP